ncbi:hypothetical protein SAE02_78570 [Skermanella aerolata]|uniref:Uncharacterized protein n=1 Tax=Skermanella aerolata TaxID=393310 RepID=A0A512E4Z2_9PROT|nr:membrane protein [Skermanella aerolata KACC 11604]GEO43709.1 hypothetical protein SAE02_78570 [Skermanella aerolata]
MAFFTLLFLASSAEAHVKWFAAYAVAESPRPPSGTLDSPWFWLALSLVLVFFIGASALERGSRGSGILERIDRWTAPLWSRADDFVRVTVGAFFVALFSVGGVYLTPELRTSSEWVSWAQLLIGALIFSRRTMPLAALGIIALWLLALRDYGLFHMLDYLALGVGVAGYLALEPFAGWRRHRFTLLRGAVAIALMWSSLEKFAFTGWFYPLIAEKPYLTLGLPADAFIQMTGVAEFTLGVGLIWTPLVRRFSALALLVIFTAAVYPFGRIDLIGHGLLMTMMVTIAADPTREIRMVPAVRRTVAGIPAGITAALVVFSLAYWGMHAALYGTAGGVKTHLQQAALNLIPAAADADRRTALILVGAATPHSHLAENPDPAGSREHRH